ncbi:MAG: hypothetical protein WAN73_05025 [Methyloceanibacter sp.]
MNCMYTAFVAGVLAFAAGGSVFAAEETSPPASPAETTAPAPDAGKDDLTAEERAEKQARKACKVKICGILATKDPQGDDVSCDIVKTWREQDITKMLGGRFDWTWGKAVCQSKLEVKREALVKAMTEAQYEVVLPEQKVRCTLAQKSAGEPYAVDISIAPKVAFENGKAVSARLNWGEAKAPMLAYALIYAGTGLDNSANILGPEVTRMVNEFTTKKCAKLKDDMPRSTGN